MKPYIVFIFALISPSFSKNPILSDEFINKINQKQSTWIAGRNFPEDTPMEKLKLLNGVIGNPEIFNHTNTRTIHVIPEAIPETFDGRTHWSNCPSLKNIRNQGSCGSCWVRLIFSLFFF